MTANKRNPHNGKTKPLHSDEEMDLRLQAVKRNPGRLADAKREVERVRSERQATQSQ